MDCLDPAFAPGVSHREPGGMSSREVIAILHQLAQQDIELIGADVVEYNPDRDMDGVTSVVAAKLLKELIALAVQWSGFAIVYSAVLIHHYWSSDTDIQAFNFAKLLNCDALDVWIGISIETNP